MSTHFTQADFARQDESTDEHFYTMPRMVVHIDDVAIAVVTDIFRRRIPPQARVLDLMSSYRSHLPQEVSYTEVVGLGMNAAEMQANPQLTRFVVHNLNQNARLPFEDQSFDAVVNTVSIQYLTQPIMVFREVARLLTPGGVHIVSFSDRMFPTKAVRIWYERSNEDHIGLVIDYFEQAGGYDRIEVERHVDEQATWYRSGNDPLFAVIGRRAIQEQ